MPYSQSVHTVNKCIRVRSASETLSHLITGIDDKPLTISPERSAFLDDNDIRLQSACVVRVSVSQTPGIMGIEVLVLTMYVPCAPHRRLFLCTGGADRRDRDDPTTPWLCRVGAVHVRW